MSAIEVSSGLQAVITPHGHYRFHWMGDHWKQEIACDGGCEAIPRIWSIEGPTTHDGHLATASPTFERLNLKQVGPEEIVARLEGHVGSRRASAVFTFEDQPDGVVVNVEVKVQGVEPGEELIATYLIESSEGDLELGEAATITWPNPETKLVFEAEPPSRVEAHKAGMGTIRLKALGTHDPAAEVQTLRYRWKWITKPWDHIWDVEA